MRLFALMAATALFALPALADDKPAQPLIPEHQQYHDFPSQPTTPQPGDAATSEPDNSVPAPVEPPKPATMNAAGHLVIQDVSEMSDFDLVRTQLEDFTQTMNRCTGKDRAYATMRSCLCETKEGFWKLYYSMNWVLQKYPDLKTHIVEYSPPDAEEPIIVDMPTSITMLVRFAPHMCRQDGK